MTSRIWT